MKKIFSVPFIILTVFTLFSSCIDRIPRTATEGRGVWISRFNYCGNVPDHDQDSIRANIYRSINEAADANFNIIFFQVRGNADAFYEPGLEPWSEMLTGELGKSPGWDPLAYAVKVAHARGLEIHAWLNTFPAWRGTKAPPRTIPLSPYLAHPEWLVRGSDGNTQPLSNHYVTFSPGNPDVHDHIIAVAEDIASRYDIDGLHYDYIRYPEGTLENGYSHDKRSEELFNSEKGNPLELDREDWQREQLNQFVIKMYNHFRREHPTLKISAAVIGSYNRGDWNGYGAVHQDAGRWAELGKIDFVTPMLYWPLAHRIHPFLKRSREWNDLHTFDRYVFPGIGSYRYNTNKQNYDPDEIMNEVEALRREGIPGMAFFDSGSLKDHYQTIRGKFYQNPAKIPPMPWKQLPASADSISLRRSDREGRYIHLIWDLENREQVHRVLLYASSDGEPDPHKAEDLVFISADRDGRLTVPAELVMNRAIAVSTVNAAWIESPLSNTVFIDSRPF